MFRAIQKLLSRRSSRRVRQGKQALRRQMTLEQLEDRRVFAGAGIYFDEANRSREVRIVGDDGPNIAHMQMQINGQLNVTLTQLTYLPIGSGLAPFVVTKSASI